MRTSRSSATSRTVRAIGPTWARTPNGLAGHAGTRPYVGLIPGRPQNPHGMRIEPPPSVPRASGTIPAASAAELPPLDPPAVRVTSHGLRVTPSSGPWVTPFQPNSGVVVLPTATAPLRASAATEGASTSQSWSGSTAFEPRSVGHPAVSSTSLIATGTPSSSPAGSPRDQRAWDRAAASRARSASTRRNALTAGSVRAIRSSAASSASRGESAPLRKSSRSAVASGIPGTREA